MSSPGGSPGSDVEFLEPDGSVAPPETPPAPRVRRVRRSWLALVLAGIGAALAVVAPFTRAYRLVFPSFDGTGRQSIALDGWGRYVGRSDFTEGHGSRLGIVYCVAAGLVVVALALWLVRAFRRAVWRRLGSGVAVFAAGVVVAIAASPVLEALATRDNYRDVLTDRAINGEDAPRVRPDAFDLSFGPLIWLSLASGVLLIAAVLVHPRDRAAGAVEPPPPPPSPPAPLHRDDELLG